MLKESGESMIPRKVAEQIVQCLPENDVLEKVILLSIKTFSFFYIINFAKSN